VSDPVDVVARRPQPVDGTDVTGRYPRKSPPRGDRRRWCRRCGSPRLTPPSRWCPTVAPRSVCSRTSWGDAGSGSVRSAIRGAVG